MKKNFDPPMLKVGTKRLPIHVPNGPPIFPYGTAVDVWQGGSLCDGSYFHLKVSLLSPQIGLSKTQTNSTKPKTDSPK